MDGPIAQRGAVAPVTCRASPAARAVTASGRSPVQTLRSCLDQLEPMPAAANLGIVYMSEPMGQIADEVLRALRARTGIDAWLGASGGGVIGLPSGPSESGLAVLVMTLPANAFSLSAALGRPECHAGLVLVHDELDEADPDAKLREIAGWHAPARPVVGALAAARHAPVQVAGDVLGSGRASLAFGAGIPIAAGIAQAGSAFGSEHAVTSAIGGEVLALDGRPALDVVGDELGDLFRHAGTRGHRQVWLAEPAQAADGGQRTRPVVAIDPARGSLRLFGDRVGTSLRVMRPDPAASLDRVQDLARSTRARLGTEPCCGIYLASRHRGPSLFGPRTDEVALLRAELGQLPLIGLSTDAEIFDGAVHEASAILVLLG